MSANHAIHQSAKNDDNDNDIDNGDDNDNNNHNNDNYDNDIDNDIDNDNDNGNDNHLYKTDVVKLGVFWSMGRGLLEAI